MSDIKEANSETPTASQIWNIIPDDLRKIIESQPGENITGANYLTITPQLQVRTPSGQVVGPDMDLNKMAQEFKSMVESELAADVIEIEDIFRANPPQPVGTDEFSFDSLQQMATPQVQVNEDQAKVITDQNQLTSLSSLISRTEEAARTTSFVDADDEDNLIEITSEDAAKLGVMRALGGNDQILCSHGNDIVYGDAGDDKMVGYDGGDLLVGGVGNDFIDGGADNDLLLGDEGNDWLVGGAGKDVLRGGAGRDVLIGKEDDDILIGGGDGDFLRGSEGADQFILRADTFTNDAADADRILDFHFNPAEGDLIKIANFQGTPGMDKISFASVNVNQDGMTDTAILSSRGVVGVIMDIDPSVINKQLSSISMVGSQDTTLNNIISFSGSPA
jgi:Ca2+-binding RTX toxin-like protein